MTDVTLVEQMKGGLDAPICLTWEITYACNLSCIHCLSSSGRRDPRELTTHEAKAFIDELHDLQVFYVNIGGGEPMIRRDFMEIVDYAIGRGVGVKFSTNGAFIDASTARRLASQGGVIGRRSPAGKPFLIRDSAYLVGPGDASEKSAAWSG